MLDIAVSAFSYFAKYLRTGFINSPRKPFLVKSTLLGSKSFICLSNSDNLSPMFSASFPPLLISTNRVASISFLEADLDMSSIPKFSKGFNMPSLSVGLFKSVSKIATAFSLALSLILEFSNFTSSSLMVSSTSFFISSISKENSAIISPFI